MLTERCCSGENFDQAVATLIQINVLDFVPERTQKWEIGEQEAKVVFEQVTS